MLPALLYVTFVAPGTDIKGLAISAVLAQTIGATAGPWLGVGVAVLGAWILFKTQLDCVEGMTRSITDILWTGSARVRALARRRRARGVLRGAGRGGGLGNHRAQARGSR